MTGLVQNPHQGAREIALVIARRDPYIVGRAAAKRMGADVEPAMGEVESDALHEAHRYPALDLDRKRANRGGRRRQSRLTGQDCFEQIGQKTRDFVEQAVDRRDQPSGLVLIEKSFVGARLEPLRLDGGDLPLQTKYLLEPGQHGGEVALWTRLPPHRLALRTGARLRFDESARHRGRMQPASTHLA